MTSPSQNKGKRAASVPPSSTQSTECEITPITVSSSNDLKQEFENLGILLADTSGQWVKRVDALRKVRALVLGGASQIPGYVQYVKDHLKEALSIQLKDLRSSVAREACSVIQSLCELAQPGQWELMSDWWLSSLFKCTYVTVAAVAESGNTTLRYIVQNGKLNPRAMKCLIDNTQTKHNVCRIRANEYVLLLLQVSPATFLEKYQEGLETALKTGLIDPIAEVRYSARMSFWAYREHFPVWGDNLLSQLDPQVQKSIQEDKENYQSLEKAQSISHAASPSMKKTAASHTRRLTGSSPRAGSVPNITGSPSVAKKGPTKRQPSCPPPNNKSSFNEDEEISVVSETLSQSGLSTASRDSSPVQGLSDNNTVPVIKKTVKPSARTSRPPPHNTTTTTATSSPSSSPTPFISKPLPTTNTNQDIPKPDVPVEQHYANTTSPSNIIQNEIPHVNIPTLNIPASSPSPPPPIIQDGSSRDYMTILSISEAHQSSISNALHEDMATILSLAEDQDWAIRVKFFDTIELMLSTPRKAEITLNLDKVMSAYVKALNDVHYKVLQAALRTMSYVARLYATEIEPYLERLLIKIFQRQFDPKEPVRRLSMELADTLMYCYHPPCLLLSVLFKVLDLYESIPKVKILCAQYLLRLMKYCQEYLSTPSNMKQALNKFHTMATQTCQKETDHICQTALHSLYILNPSVFIAQMLTLNPSDQNDIKERLASILPQLGEEMKQFRTVKRSTSAPGNRTHNEVVVDARIPPQQDTSPPRATIQSTNKPINEMNTPHRTTKSGSISTPNSTTQPKLPNSDVKPYDPSRYQITQIANTPTQTTQSSINKDPAQVSHTTDQNTSNPQTNILTSPDAIQLVFNHFTNNSIPLSPTNALDWDRDLGSFLCLVLDNVKQSETSVRVQAIIILKNLIIHHTVQCNLMVPIIVQRLMDCCGDPCKDICNSADDALQEAIQRLNAQRCMECVIDELHTNINNVQASISLIGKLVHRVGPDELEQQVPSFIDGLYEGFKHKNADVRKAVVFCLVDIYSVLKERLNPWLKPLNTSQIKLVTIYINRQQQRKEDAPLGGLSV